MSSPNYSVARSLARSLTAVIEGRGETLSLVKAKSGDACAKRTVHILCLYGDTVHLCVRLLCASVIPCDTPALLPLC